MTPDQHAEKIVVNAIENLCLNLNPKKREGWKSFLETEIREAIFDDRDSRTADDLYALSRQLGKKEAYADAAKVVHKGECARWSKHGEGNGGCQGLCEEVRARAAEIGKGK